MIWLPLTAAPQSLMHKLLLNNSKLQTKAIAQFVICATSMVQFLLEIDLEDDVKAGT